MREIGWILALSPFVVGLYAFVAYPALLGMLARVLRGKRPALPPPSQWPVVSISLPVYNEEIQIREVLESLLALEYPADRRQIMVISDASSDRTDAIAEEYRDRGVELLRLPQRAGKTAAENAAAPHLSGEIIVNTDASIRIRPDALRHLVANFTDPEVGVASGRDISVASTLRDRNVGEAGYVSYEMRVRALETRVSGIIGASGCFYAVRAHLHREPLPAHLSRDFAAALIAREHGYRSLSVDAAVCLVPRTTSLKQEHRRKVRTMSRGIETLMHKRHLLNPFRFGWFAWMLFSHKVCRWLVPVAGVAGAVGLAILSIDSAWARWVLAAGLIGAALALAGWKWPTQSSVPRLMAFLAAAVSVQIATLTAILRALHGDQNAAWEPTRREVEMPAERAR